MQVSRPNIFKEIKRDPKRLGIMNEKISKKYR